MPREARIEQAFHDLDQHGAGGGEQHDEERVT
jgi:hypothetical protein